MRTCGAFPPTAARRAPHRSRSHGRLRRPKSLPIRHSPAAAQCRPFLGWRDCLGFDLCAAAIANSGLEIKNRCTEVAGMYPMAAAIAKSGLEIDNRCTDCPCFDLLATSIRKSGPEIKNRCTDIPEMCFIAAAIANSGPKIKNRCTKVPEMSPMDAAIAKSGPEIGNHCMEIPETSLLAAAIVKSRPEIGNHSSAIVSASRMARLQQVLPLRCRVRFYFSSPQSRTVPPTSVVAATMPCLILIFCRLKEEWFRLQLPLRQRRTVSLHRMSPH